jgi:hypothetical protein
MWTSTKIKPLIKTNRTVRASRNLKAVALFNITLICFWIGYGMFYLGVNIPTPGIVAWLLIVAFLLGYLIAWVKHGRLFQRIAKTKEYMNKCGYSRRVAWRRAGTVIE